MTEKEINPIVDMATKTLAKIDLDKLTKKVIECLDVLHHVATNSEKDHVRVQAARYLIQSFLQFKNAPEIAENNDELLDQEVEKLFYEVMQRRQSIQNRVENRVAINVQTITTEETE